MKNHFKSINRKNIKRFLCVVNSAVLLTTTLYSPQVADEVSHWIMTARAAVDSNNLITENINSLRELYEFSASYANSNEYDTYDLHIGVDALEGLTLEKDHQFQKVDADGNLLYHPSADSDEETTTVTEYPAMETLHYTPIGTDSKPFRGQITLNATSGSYYPVYLDEPMFGCICDSVEIIRIGGGDIPLSLNRSAPLGDDENEALFAQHIVHDSRSGSSPAIWQIYIYPSIDEHGTYHIYNFSGLFGEIGTATGDQTVVNVEFQNNAKLDGVYAVAQSSGSIGMICGKINTGSTVNVKLLDNSDSSYAFDVVSFNGSAGKLVGEMTPSSTLNVKTSNIDMLPSTGTVAAKEYAGALVGKNDCGSVSITDLSDDSILYTSSGDALAETGAGGIFGYCKANADVDFSTKYSLSGAKVCAQYAGGFVGVFEGNGHDVVYSGTASSVLSGKQDLTVNETAHSFGNTITSYGGIFGQYANTSLTKTFTINSAVVTAAIANSPAVADPSYFGGAIGEIRSGNTDAAAYVYVDGNSSFTISSGCALAKYFGGIVGSAGSKGSMLDIGNVTVSTRGAFKGGGIVGYLNKGVLRLSGTTNMSGAQASSGGQLVGTHGDSLVYAVGTGKDESPSYGSGWRFVRSTTASATDDIGTWGEVVRIPDIEGKAAVGDTPAIADIVSFDDSAHTAKIAAANTAITNERVFTQTALNMKLNGGSDVGALCFADKSASSKRDDLLKASIEITGTIDLSGTGITGLMRDNNNDNKFFNGSITGYSNATVKLAVGERYGVSASGTKYGTGNGETNTGYNGVICTHSNNGLIARTGAGVTSLPNISDVKIDGVMNITATGNDVYAGGAVAYVRNGINLIGVDAVEEINYCRSNGDSHFIGGLIGYVYCAQNNNDNKDYMNDITIDKSASGSTNLTIQPTITVTGELKSDDNSSGSETHFHSIGGLIGFIDTDIYQKYDINISNINLSAKIDASGADAAANVSTAGLIADILSTGKTENADVRNLKLNNVIVKDTSVKNTATATTGGILGYRWNNTNVEFDNVKLNVLEETVNGSTVQKHNTFQTNATHVGGLVYKATGHWEIGSAGLAVNSLNLSTNADTLETLGVMIHDGHSGNAGVFLELTAADSYTLAPSPALSIPMPEKGKTVYDELVAYIAKDETELLNNGTSGVISIHNGTYFMNGSSCNSYQNTYNPTAKNKYSRYYYNVDSTNRTSPENGWKLLVWSLNRYAATNIKKYFKDPFYNSTTKKSIVTGTFDLNGISYYPIDIGTDVTLGDITVKFYNPNIEATETLGAAKRLTRDGLSQHYTMHCGLFRNVTKAITATGDIHLQGDSGITSASNNNAAFIGGTLTGSFTTSDTKRIYLEGLTISDSSKYLLINSIGSNATLELYGLSVITTGNEVYTETEITNGVASSLIGDVVGSNITLDFKNIKLDSRISSSASGNNYGTSKSIFTCATLLNKLDVDSTSKAKYNYSHDDDWGTSGGSVKHNVTYGREIIDSQENSGNQNKYYEESGTRYYTRPDADPASATNDAYSAFNSYAYLPYVKDYKTGTGYTYTSGGMHELKVNVLIAGLTSGCGTYNDPYVISTLEQLEALDKLLRGNDSVTTLSLPVTQQTQAEFASDHWCTGSSYHAVYTLTDGNFGSWTFDDAREYLAGAYYQINGNIDIPTTSSFAGLGDTNSSSEKYAFRGVIVGNGTVRITNHTVNPFIRISNGAVVKGVDFTVNIPTSTTVVTSGSNATAFAYTLNNKSIYYGAVMGEIMGGDNIIDDVTVTYTNPLKVSGNNNYLYTVGGFVGVVVNGGLVFRNMPENNLTSYAVGNGTTNDYHLEEITKTVDNETVTEFNSKHLYINPYVGRVINGYAINEVDPSDDEDAEYGNYTLDNSAKNYRIPDIITGTHDEEKQVQRLDEYDEPVTDPETGEPIMDTVTETVENYNRLDVDLSDSTEPKIKIPDGQSLFILSLITQSGAGTATGAASDYQYAVAYDGTTRYNSTSAAKNAATHVSQYSDVGSSANQTGADYVASTKDTVASKQAVPYIIYNYTKAYSNTYHARTVTGYATPFRMELTTAGGTYDLPDCFRGIGSLCPYDMSKEQYTMNLYGMNGKGAIVNCNIDYKTYCYTADNYIKTVYGDNKVYNAFGFFNHLKQTKAPDMTDNAENLNNGYFIGNFTLSGVVKVEEYSSGGVINNGYGLRWNKSKRQPQRYAVGGFVGGTNHSSYINLFNLDMDNMTVSGNSSMAVGGYVGRVNIAEDDDKYGKGMSYIYVNGCDTSKTKIEATNSGCGGILGVSYSDYASVYVNTAEFDDTDTNISAKGDDGYYKSTMELTMNNYTTMVECGTGGIIGCMRNGYNVQVWINNVTISGWEGTESVIGSENSYAGDTSEPDLVAGSGGLIGYIRKASSVIVTNCTVQNINVKGAYAGGLFGNIAYFATLPEYGIAPKISIYNCKVCDTDAANDYTITGIKYSGGLSGQFITNKTYEHGTIWNGVIQDNNYGYDGEIDYIYDVNGCEVSNYTIEQSGTDANTGVGGIIGFANNGTRTIVNSSVHGCSFKTKSSSTHGMGGIIGYTSKDILGYNIASYDNTFADYGGATSTDAKYGNFIGIANSKNIKIVGFNAKDNTFNNVGVSKECGDTLNSSSYIVCADYTGTSRSATPNTAFSGLTVLASGKPNIDDGPNDDYFPYVVVNPKTVLGERAFLTGDGSALYDRKTVKKVDGAIQYEEDGVTPQYDTTVYPAAKAVVDDLGTDTDVFKNNLSTYNGYQTANGTDGKNDRTRVEQMFTNAASTSDPDLKLTTYFTEIGKPNGYEGEDFPIIAIDGNSSTDDYTNYITSYIRLMTNTSEAYTGDVTGKYKINIYRCRISNTGDYDIYGDTNTGIKLSTNKYSMDNSFADTYMPNNQISLIDVQFYDPTNSDNIAYHLYVPVLTKKMLNFKFYSSVMQGTEYKSNLYNDFGNANPGSFDNWITSYVKYEYAVGDINTYLNSGKGLNWNCDKAVTFEYSGQKAVAGSTQYVLLDNNNGRDREYYLTKSDDSTMNTSIVGKNTTDTIRFANFTTKRGDDQIIFRPQALNDFVGTRLQYSSTSGTKMYALCDDQVNHLDAIAWAYDENGENLRYFKSGGTYSITLTGSDPIVETYYLGMYTFSSDNSLSLNNGTNGAYGIVVSCPKTLAGDTATCKRSNTDANPTTNATLYLGDIFTQTLTLSGLNPNHEIDAANHEITATMTSTVSISDTADAAYFQQGLSGKNIYQAFMLCLKQYDKNNKLKSDHAIKGSPQYSYTLNTTSTNTEESLDSKLADDALYVPVGPIAITVDSFDNNPNWNSTQTASVNVVFSDDINELNDEFPVRETGDKNGVGVSAYAKLDYSSTNIFYSSNTKSEDNKDKYYMTKSDDAVLILTAEDQTIDDGYDKYGELSCNRSSLGINAKYDGKLSGAAQTEHIDVKVDFDITNLPSTVITSGKYSLTYKFELYQKQDDGEYHLVNIKDYGSEEDPTLGYLENFTFTGSGVVSLTDCYNDDNCYYISDEMELDSEDMANWSIPYSATDKAFSAMMSFDVKTKGKLQKIPNYLYSNYQVKVTADLISTDPTDRNYQATSWIVYTNAKVNAQYVSPVVATP